MYPVSFLGMSALGLLLSLVGSVAASPGEQQRAPNGAIKNLGALKSSLGQVAGAPGFDDALDLNSDGVVNVLDVALARQGSHATSKGDHQPPHSNTALVEAIVISPISTIATPGDTMSVLFLIQNNTTPLLGYSLDVNIVGEPGSQGSVTANIASTNFFDVQNLITAGGAVRDPLFSVVQDNGQGGVFINTITDNNSTVLAVDGVNDVLAEVFFDVGYLACGDFSIQLGVASALSDGIAQSVPFSFDLGTITVVACPVPAVSQWGLLILTLGLLTAATLLFRFRVKLPRP